MDNKYKGELLRAAASVRELQDKINAAVKQGKVQTKPWLIEQRNVLLKLAKAEMQEPLIEMQKMATQNYIDSIKNAEVKRRGVRGESPLKPVDSTARLFEQQRAASMMRGLSPADTIEQFKELVSVFSEDEKQHKWIYEDVLRSMVRDKEFTLQVEKVIDEFRSQEERDAIKAMDKAAMFREHDTTLRNLLLAEAEGIAKGDGAAGYDWGSLFDEMVQNIESQAATQSERETAFNNKYSK